MRSLAAVLSGVLATVAAAGIGAAASLALSAGTLGHSGAAMGRCATGGIGTTPVLTGATVTSVVVDSIPAACGGASLTLTVSDGTLTGSGSATVPGAGGSVSVGLTGAPALLTSVQVDLVITGP